MAIPFEHQAYDAVSGQEEIDALSETVGGHPQPAAEPAWREAGFVWTLLPRHGRRPARFLGRDLLRANNRAAAGAGQLDFWSDIQVFELYTGGFMTAVRHFQAANDQAGWQDTWFSSDAAAVILSLKNHGSAGAWPQAAHGANMATRLQAWLALIRAAFGETRPA